MRKTFQKWLFVFIALAFVITFCFSLYIQTKQAERNTESMIHLKIGDVRKQINQNEQNIVMLKEILKERSLARVRSFAQMIAYNPDVLKNQQELKNIRKQLDVDELDIIDENGIIIASDPPETVGYDMKSDEQSRPFMKAIEDPDFVLIQEPKKKGFDGELFQYAGIARIDKPGIVQIGVRPKRLEDAMKIAALENLASGFRIGTNGEIIICQGEKIVSVKNKEWLNKNIRELLHAVSFDVFNQESGSFKTSINGVQHLLHYEKFNDFMIIGTIPNSEMYTSRNSVAVALIAVNLVLFLVVFVLVSQLVQKIVIDGIYQVNNSLKKITGGDLKEVVDVKTNEEFSRLSTGINLTVGALKKAIHEAKSRIDYELECARKIQLSALPSFFPPFPDRTEIDIFASLDMAKEVGGDFYDFQFVDNDHLAFYIADVSGKGIPAALFMMTAKTILKDLLNQKMELNEVARCANEYLCENNEAVMFVTVFLAVLEISTGKLTTVNCGHNYPIWLRNDRRKTEWIDAKGGLMLGGMSGIEYHSSIFQLAPGDRIFLYTDGVTEALDKSGDLFGDDRLKEFMDRQLSEKERSLCELLTGVKKDVEQFIDGAVQSDDMTMLALVYRGSKTA